jgi:hypothetical protein
LIKKQQDKSVEQEEELLEQRGLIEKQQEEAIENKKLIYEHHLQIEKMQTVLESLLQEKQQHVLVEDN